MQYTSRPTRFVCFTDDPRGIDPSIEIMDIPEVNLPSINHSPGWRKPSLWAYPLGDLEGDVLFLDLDVVICGDLDRFFDFMPGEYCVIENWPQKGEGIGNTTCFKFQPGKFKYIFDRYNADPDGINAIYGIEQKYISAEIEAQYFWPEQWCESFKHTILPPWPLRFLKTPQPHPNTSVVAFTGKPDPDEAMVGKWPTEGEPWKKIYKYTRPCPWIADYWNRADRAE